MRIRPRQQFANRCCLLGRTSLVPKSPLLAGREFSCRRWL